MPPFPLIGNNMKNNIEIINQWVWDDYYQRYFWKPLYCISSASLEADETNQSFKKDTSNKEENDKEVH